MTEYRARIYLTAKILKEKINHPNTFIISHQIKIFNLSTLKKIENVFGHELDQLRKCKFRNNTTINYHFLAMNYEAFVNKTILYKLNNENSFFIANKHKIDFFIFLLKYNLINFNFLKNKKFVCINSLCYDHKKIFIKLMKFKQIYSL